MKRKGFLRALGLIALSPSIVNEVAAISPELPTTIPKPKVVKLSTPAFRTGDCVEINGIKAVVTGFSHPIYRFTPFYANSDIGNGFGGTIQRHMEYLDEIKLICRPFRGEGSF